MSGQIHTILRRAASLLSAVFLAACSGTVSSPDTSAADSTVLLPPETEQLLFSTTILSDYSSFSSLDSLIRQAPVILRGTVVSQEDAIVIGNYSEDAFDRYDALAREQGRIAADLLMSVRTPYTITVQEICKADDTRDVLAVGEQTQICTIGGICRGYQVETEFPVLAVGEEYIFFLTRRNFAAADEPKYTLYSPYQCAVLVDELGTNKGTCADKIYLDVTLEQLQQRFRTIE